MDRAIRYIEREAEEISFSGVISMEMGNGDRYCKGFGFRDRKNGEPNTPTTKFGIASGTKLFTALGIGRLVDLGRISLTTAVEDIAPGIGAFIDGRATILHLLTHTSGIYDYYDEEKVEDFDGFTVEIPWCRLETPSDYLPLFEDKEMKFRPGERYSYSNGGFVFLGILIERMTGESYQDFIEEQVLMPAGMGDSGFFAFDDLPENTADGYIEDGVTTNIYRLPKRGGGDGGMFTTAGDLSIFWKRLFGAEILSRELTAEYLRTHWTFGEADGYGCGIYKRLDNGRFWINGCDAGAGFHSMHAMDPGVTISVLSNDTDGASAIMKRILSTLNNG